MKAKLTQSIVPALTLLCLCFLTAAQGQKMRAASDESGRAVLFQNVNIANRDTFYGPGGRDMQPDLSQITFIEKETHGYNKKYRIKDGSGRIWVAKYGREAKPETAAVRLLWALGYPTEINYWVPELTIPTVGTLRNVRLEARPDDIKRGDYWTFNHNPFLGTNELQGLKIMMVLFNNWDLKSDQNKVIKDKRTGTEYYIVSDLGATFGKLGSNNLPIFWRFGRSINRPRGYARTELVKGVKNGRLKLAFKGKNSGYFKDITIAQGRWLADRLLQLRDEQIRDAFRAANYSPSDINILTNAVKSRINELDVATSPVERIAIDRQTGIQRRSRSIRTRRH